MNLTYAIPDLHGADDLLKLGLAAIDRHAAAALGGSRTVVLLGDYVDRGPGSRQIIERLIDGPSEGWRWFCLKGNQEDIMLAAWHGHIGASYWREVGGIETLASYGSNAWITDEVQQVVPFRACRLDARSRRSRSTTTVSSSTRVSIRCVRSTTRTSRRCSGRGKRTALGTRVALSFTGVDFH